ncbi:MAG: TonB-dependent receptor [Bacteroidales bacterium]|nr:TonB-dependent receptor [Bacteroidales bacterium]
MKKIYTTTRWKSFSILRIPFLIVGISSFLLVQNLAANNNLQEEKPVTGIVTDASTGEPLPGVSILIKGTSKGSITDVEGKYTVNAKSSDILVFSYVGFLNEEVPVGSQTDISISLTPDIIGLDEIVVIGYGVQKKKLNTGANLNVSGEDIEALNTTGTMDALKGLSPGVSITQNNGVPGSGNKIFIRGIGTIGNYEPLYIVDGVAVEDIDNLSPSDIESIDILKDAASAAIYGSRGANGVILVTTRQGRRGAKPTINYHGYYGWQNVYNPPELLNAQEYANAMNEAALNTYPERGEFDFTATNTHVPDWDRIESGEWEGTNWYKEIENPNAPIQSHALNITGGSEASAYSLGASYLKQDGVIGKQVNNGYERINLRLNSEHVLFEALGRDIIVLGENVTYTNEKNPTIRTGNIYWNDLHNMLVTSPFLPMYADSLNDPSYPYHGSIGWNLNEGNPIAAMENEAKWNTNNNNTILGNVYLQLQPVKNLILRSAFGINSWWSSSRHWTPSYNLSAISTNTRDQLDQNMYSGYTWTSTNTITYSFDIADQHNVTVLAGHEAQKNARDLHIEGHNEGSVFNDPEYAYLDNFPPLDASNAALASFGSQDKYGWGLLSYFGRLSYDFREKYLFTAVLRADGSSNFPKENRWSTFPSFAAGWILSNEPFMDNMKSWLSFAKLRFSWGQNGNQDVGRDFVYLSTLQLTGVNYYFGPEHDLSSVGSSPTQVPNSNIRWETSEQTDVGLDMNFLNNKLQFAFDWYRKDTKDWLIDPPASAMLGTLPPWLNGGQIRNQGIELMLQWNQRKGDFSYDITGTLAYNKNEVINLPSADSVMEGPTHVLSQGMDAELFRAEQGYPVGYFYGFETDGILQNEAEVAAWVGPDGEPYFDDAAPGDVRFVDQNNDGVIDDEDKVMIGNPHPDFILGLRFSAEYKGIFVQLYGYGHFGQQVAKNYRSVDSYRSNFTKEVYDQRWHGDGTSDRYPRLTQGGHRNWQEISDIYIEDADFFRISNLTIGYDFATLFKSFPFSEFRVYGAVKNLYTFTKYPGMDPEVGYSPENNDEPDEDYPWGSGIDLGLVPQSRTFMVGVNITF